LNKQLAEPVAHERTPQGASAFKRAALHLGEKRVPRNRRRWSAVPVVRESPIEQKKTRSGGNAPPDRAEWFQRYEILKQTTLLENQL
jgi:hypothetical protein